MSIQFQSETQFEARVLRNDLPVIVEFSATWCAPCKAMNSVLNEFAKDFETHLEVVKVDVDRDREIANAYSVQSVPTTILFVEGKERKRMIGAVNKQALADFVLDEVY